MSGEELERNAEEHSARFRAQCLISFGSNLGDRHDLITEAARRIAKSDLFRQSGDLYTSRLFETPPIGGPGGQEAFLNAIGAFETNASARDVLTLLQQLENDLGRQRRRRWDARSIDLDVVLHGELVGGGTGLIVPHPRYTARQFVLQPACDVAANYRDPRFGWTLQQLADHVSAGSPSMALVGDLQTRKTICKRLHEEHGITTFAPSPLAQPMRVVGNVPAPNLESGTRKLAEPGEPIKVQSDEPWVSGYLPDLPSLESGETQLAQVPRLVVRIQRTTDETQWPAPHQIWTSGWTWPEYRLEVSDLDWAITELVSALESMRCPVRPVTNDENWWQ